MPRPLPMDLAAVMKDILLTPYTGEAAHRLRSSCRCCGSALPTDASRRPDSFCSVACSHEFYGTSPSDTE